MTLLTWKDSYRIGNEAIDAEHQELFKRVNAFLQAQDKPARMACGMHLYQYTRKHFGHEEDLMRALHYPETDTHIELHNDLISRLNSVSESIANDTLDMTELAVFLSDWLLGHIRLVDSKLAAYVRKQPQETRVAELLQVGHA